MSLQEIFACIPGAVSLHEPHPAMSGKVFLNCNDSQSVYRDKVFYERKVPHIYWAARNADLYIETNHLFIKSFADLALSEFGRKLKVIYLHRDKIEVACSYDNRHSATQHDIDELDNWVLNPDSQSNLLRIDDVVREYPVYNSVFYRALWYCYETEARTRAFSLQHPDVPVVEINTHDLNSIEKVSNLLQRLGNRIPEGLSSVVGTKANVDRRTPGLPASIDPADVAEFQSICSERLERLGLKWDSD